MAKHKKIVAALRPGTEFSNCNQALCFLAGDRLPRGTAGGSLLGKIQERLKKHGSWYYLLIKLLAPALASREMKRRLRDLLSEHGEESFVINLGSGPQVLAKRRDIINIDLFAFDTVDIVANAAELPFDDNSVDLIINQAMLEHVENPAAVVLEMHRILRPGGVSFCYLPFIVPYHAAPHDFHRWTMSGAANLFQEFELVVVGVGAGPTSGMLWPFQEWLATLLSFGSRRLHDIFFLLIMVATAPVKLLDTVLAGYPGAEKVAAGFYVVAQKKSSCPPPAQADA